MSFTEQNTTRPNRETEKKVQEHGGQKVANRKTETRGGGYFSLDAPEIGEQ